MGKTILISSHILTELADCCTSIGIIERGQLLMHGPIDEVYRRIRGNRMIEIKFVDSMEAGLSIIRSLPETRDVQVEDHRVTVELEADDQARGPPAGRTHQPACGCAASPTKTPRWKTCSCWSPRGW